MPGLDASHALAQDVQGTRASLRSGGRGSGAEAAARPRGRREQNQLPRRTPWQGRSSCPCRCHRPLTFFFSSKVVIGKCKKKEREREKEIKPAGFFPQKTKARNLIRNATCPTVSPCVWTQLEGGAVGREAGGEAAWGPSRGLAGLVHLDHALRPQERGSHTCLRVGLEREGRCPPGKPSPSERRAPEQGP